MGTEARNQDLIRFGNWLFLLFNNCQMYPAVYKANIMVSH